MKILHIYASKAVFNSGDYMIGKSYKYKAQKVWGNNITFVSFDCRNSKLYNSDGAIAKLNTFVTRCMFNSSYPSHYIRMRGMTMCH